MSKQTESSLFIVSPFERTKFYQQLLSGITTYQELGNRIHEKIRTAHAFNQTERVRELARMLVNIPVREYQLIGQYYLVWCKCREREYQSELLERIAEQSQTYKAKALISRGAFEVYQGSPERALYFYTEALKPNPTVSDFIKASTGIATVKAIEGYHASALSDIENLLPLARYAEPLTYFQTMNSYATELIEANRLSEAENAVLVAVSSPLGPFDPEWRNTLADVRSRQKRRSAVTITRPRTVQEYEIESEVPDNPLHEARAQAAIDFMRTNLHRSITLLELSELVNLSPSHFSSVFKTQIGVSPIEYLIRLRIEKASHLLATTFLSIKQVMATVGYSDRQTFLQHFKRRFDLTPSAYRKRALGRSRRY
ncbi:MAG: helix-turn-helix domain-containing protein [Acidobacteriota bacterium]